MTTHIVLLFWYRQNSTKRGPRKRRPQKLCRESPTSWSYSNIYIWNQRLLKEKKAVFLTQHVTFSLFSNFILFFWNIDQIELQLTRLLYYSSKNAFGILGSILMNFIKKIRDSAISIEIIENWSEFRIEIFISSWCHENIGTEHFQIIITVTRNLVQVCMYVLI